MASRLGRRGLVALAWASVLAGCAGGKNAPEGAKVRYEPSPELPPYEVEARKDPLSVLEALGSPAPSGSGGLQDGATPVAAGGGAAVDASAP